MFHFHGLDGDQRGTLATCWPAATCTATIVPGKGVSNEPCSAVPATCNASSVDAIAAPHGGRCETGAASGLLIEAEPLDLSVTLRAQRLLSAREHRNQNSEAPACLPSSLTRTA